jgi:hypothetical protein
VLACSIGNAGTLDFSIGDFSGIEDGVVAQLGIFKLRSPLEKARSWHVFFEGQRTSLYLEGVKIEPKLLINRGITFEPLTSLHGYRVLTGKTSRTL